MTKNKLTPIFATFIGTVLEWYDFSIFIFFIPIFSEIFFPKSAKSVAILSLYSVFAISFFIRPLGAVVLGYFGDRKGRKAVLVFSMMIISLVTFLTGLLPTYADIGLLAPICLIFFRLVQGFCVGGETTGSASFIIETFSQTKRGFLGSLMWSGVGVGLLLGSLVSSAILNLMSHETLYSIGWRLPFILGMLTGVVGYYFRKKIPESALFVSIKNNDQITKLSTLAIVRENKKSLLIIIGLYALSSVVTYLVFIFMPVYASSALGIEVGKANGVTTLAMLFVTLGIPLAGLLSDKIGRKPCLFIGALGFCLFSYPLFSLMLINKSIVSLIIAETVFVIIALIYQGTLTSAIQEIPLTSVRYTITALGYNISYALFGGTVPFVIMHLSHWFDSQIVPGVYLLAVSLMAVIAIFNMHETYKKIL